MAVVKRNYAYDGSCQCVLALLCGWPHGAAFGLLRPELYVPWTQHAVLTAVVACEKRVQVAREHGGTVDTTEA